MPAPCPPPGATLDHSAVSYQCVTCCGAGRVAVVTSIFNFRDSGVVLIHQAFCYTRKIYASFMFMFMFVAYGPTRWTCIVYVFYGFLFTFLFFSCVFKFSSSREREAAAAAASAAPHCPTMRVRSNGSTTHCLCFKLFSLVSFCPCFYVSGFLCFLVLTGGVGGIRTGGRVGGRAGSAGGGRRASLANEARPVQRYNGPATHCLCFFVFSDFFACVFSFVVFVFVCFMPAWELSCLPLNIYHLQTEGSQFPLTDLAPREGVVPCPLPHCPGCGANPALQKHHGVLFGSRARPARAVSNAVRTAQPPLHIIRRGARELLGSQAASVL